LTIAGPMANIHRLRTWARSTRPGPADDTNFMDTPLLFHFSTVVWGPWHVGAFLDVNLPSLLAPGNLPAFAARHDVVYRIFTSPRDVQRIVSSSAFKQAQALVAIELVECPVDNAESPIAMHHLLWRRSIDEAHAAGAMILFVPPDVIWANGSFGHVADLAAQGKRAIFMTYVRVMQETCVPDVRRLYASQASPVIDVSSRELVDLALRHIHPLTITYMRHSPNFPIHPEFVLWPVPGEGLLMRVLVREMFAYDPKMIDLNQQALMAHTLDPDLVHCITDSDDLFALSLAPADKDIEWYSKPQTLDVLELARWWLSYDSPINDLVASKYFYIHSGSRSPDKWRQAELGSDVLLRRAIGTREILRVLSGMDRPELQKARQILALALVETRLARTVRLTGRGTLLVPCNAAVLRWLLEGGDALLQPKNARKLVALILDHIIVGRVKFRTGEPAVLEMASGALRHLTWQDGTALVDGVAVKTPGFELGQHRSYVADSVLPAVMSRRGGSRPARSGRPGEGAERLDGLVGKQDSVLLAGLSA